MARVYKEVKQNGKAIKKWVDEYIAFEFDEDGNIINDTSEYGYNANEYDENGNRTDLPCCFENEDSDDDSEPIFESDNLLYNFDWSKKVNIEKLGNQVIKVIKDKVNKGGYKEIVWNTNNGTEIYSLHLGYVDLVDLENFKKEFDEDNNLIYLKKYSLEFFFEYDENKLIHLKEIDTDCSEYEDDEERSFEQWSFEKWFEYDGEKLEHSKDSDGEESFYRYDSKGCLVYEKNWRDDEDGTCFNETEYEYDSNRNLLHKMTKRYDSTDDDGNLSSIDDTLFEYDSNGNLLHKVTKIFDSIEEYEEGNFSSINSEIKNVYDSNNKMIFAQSGECITKWDSFGNIIYEKNNFGEYKNEYNSNGQLIHSIHKIPQGESESSWYGERNYEKKWNDNGKLVFSLYSDEKEIFEYNENNKLIHYIKVSKEDNEDSKYEEWCEYNDGILIHKKCSDGEEYKYNSQGKLIYYRDSDLETYWNECDSNGNPIHFKSDEVEEWYEYELYDNGNIKKKICYRAI